MRYLFGFLCVCALGVAPVVGCIVSETNPCGNCDDGNPCTLDSCGKRCLSPFGCYEWVFECKYSSVTDGTPCGSGKVCVEGLCGENLCADCVDDGNECTTYCDYETGACNEPLYGDTCVCEELDCDDGDLCTTDHCDDDRGCVNDPVSCWDGDRCATCDPETGECNDALAEGRGCVANRELGIGGTYLLGSCESGRCTGQLCDVTSEEVYLCPVKDAPDILEPWICCPWEHLPHYPRGYCTTHDNCLTALCQVECPSHWLECVYQDGVCPSP